MANNFASTPGGEGENNTPNKQDTIDTPKPDDNGETIDDNNNQDDDSDDLYIDHPHDTNNIKHHSSDSDDLYNSAKDTSTGGNTDKTTQPGQQQQPKTTIQNEHKHKPNKVQDDMADIFYDDEIAMELGDDNGIQILMQQGIDSELKMLKNKQKQKRIDTSGIEMTPKRLKIPQHTPSSNDQSQSSLSDINQINFAKSIKSNKNDCCCNKIRFCCSLYTRVITALCLDSLFILWSLYVCVIVIWFNLQSSSIYAIIVAITQFISIIFWLFILVLNTVAFNRISVLDPYFWLFKFKATIIYCLMYIFQLLWFVDLAFLSSCSDSDDQTIVCPVMSSGFITPLHVLLSFFAMEIYWRLYLWSKYYQKGGVYTAVLDKIAIGKEHQAAQDTPQKRRAADVRHQSWQM